MRCTYKSEVTEYRGLFIKTSCREAKGNQVGTIMCVTFTDKDCKKLFEDDKRRIVSHIATTKETTMKLLEKKIDKILKKGAMAS